MLNSKIFQSYMRSIAYRDAKKKIEDLTKEVENLKSKLEDKAYNFKKYDHSSEIATKLIECHAKWESNIKNKKKPSFGCLNLLPITIITLVILMM